MSSRSFAHASHCRHVDSNCALASSNVLRSHRRACQQACRRCRTATRTSHAVGPAALFVDAAHGPSAAVDGEVLPVLVDPAGSSVGRLVSGMS